MEDGLGREKAGPPVGRLEVMKASEPAATIPYTRPGNRVVVRIQWRDAQGSSQQNLTVS